MVGVHQDPEAAWFLDAKAQDEGQKTFVLTFH